MSNNVGRVIRNVDKLKDELEERADAALRVSMEGLVREMQRHLVTNDSVATGELHNNLDPRKLGDAHYGIFAPDYWKYLEYGTGLYTSRGYKAPSPAAPYTNILLWVKAKGITPKPHLEAQTQEQLAAMIAESISTGTQSHPFARPAWRGPRGKERVISNTKQMMQRAVDRAF